MTDKKTSLVMAIKTKDGETILGFYFGEADGEGIEPRVVLHRPITIKMVTYSGAGKPINAYLTDSYFQYGSQTVSIPYSEISHQDIASDFFSMFYLRSVGELMLVEETLQNSYIKFFEDSDLKDILRETDSIYVNCETEHLQ